MLDRVEFLVGEALTALRRNTWMSFSAITTVAMALFLIGGLGYAYLGVQRYANSLSERFDMRVFLRDGLSREKVSETAKKIRAIPGVRAALLIPKDKAWENFRRQLPSVVEGIDNPLPDGLKVHLTEVAHAQAVAAKIGALPEVEPNGVRFMDDERQLLSESLALLRSLGFALGGLMLLTGGVLIYNAIRLTIVARRREIRIMQLVGATRATVVTPLLIEGVLQGFAGGVLASILVWSAHQGLQGLIAKLSVTAKLQEFPFATWCMLLAVSGAAYGLACSIVAVRDPRGIR